MQQAGEGEGKSSNLSFQGHAYIESHKIDMLPETAIQQYINADFGAPQISCVVILLRLIEPQVSKHRLSWPTPDIDTAEA